MSKDFIRTTGKIIKVRKCWWIKVNKKPVRLNGLGGALFPHLMTVSYSVNGKKYKKTKYIGLRENLIKLKILILKKSLYQFLKLNKEE